MKARGVRLHAANDLRLEEFELPEITDDEILVKVVSDSICMSTYKCAILGTEHKRVHEDVAEHPALFLRREGSGPPAQMGRPSTPRASQTNAPSRRTSTGWCSR